jgi:hypothetical protein
MPKVESSPPPSKVESAPKVEAEAPASPSKNDVHAMPPTDSFERTSSARSVSSTSPTEKTEATRSVGAPSSRATKNFDSDTREEIKKLAGSESAEVKKNRDDSETRTRKTQNERATRERQLTQQRGLLREEQTRFTDSTTRTQENGNVNKHTVTSKSETDFLGRQTSSVARETSRTRGLVDSESGQTKTTTTRTTATDQLGIEKNTESRTTTVTQGADDKNNVARSTTTSTTTDSRGNSQSSQETKTVNTNGSTTVTRTSTTSNGSSLTTQGTAGLSDDKFTVGQQATYKNERSTNSSITREREFQPERTDKGFTPQRNDPVKRLQTGADVLGAMGARTTLAKNEIPKEAMNETAWSKSDTSFVGTRNGIAGKYEVTGGADGIRAKGNFDASAGFHAETRTPDIEKGQAGTQGSANFKAEVAARAKGNATINTNGVDASGQAKIGGTVETSLTGRAQSSSVNIGGVDMNASVDASLKGSATLAAEVNGKFKATRSPPEFVAEGSMGGSAVLKAEGESTFSAGPFSAKVNGYGSLGAEAKVGGSIGYENGKLKFSANAGLALGIGGGGGVSGEVDLAQIGQVAKNTALRVGDANGDGRLGLDDARVMATNAVNTARNTVNSAANTVRGWFGW